MRNFNFLIDTTYESGYESLTYVPYKEFQSKENIEFELSMWSIDGNIIENEIIFDISENFKINSVKLKVSKALYFNEDGSGGVWSASDEYFSVWMYADQADSYIYEIPASNDIIYAEIPSDAYAKAEEETNNNPNLGIYEYESSFVIQIDYSVNGKSLSKEIYFYFSHGD